MTDYAQALKQGLEAAEQAKANEEEVNKVFNELNETLGKESGGKIKIIPKEVKVMPAPTVSPLVELGLRPYEKYWAIVACNPSIANGSEFVLAKWKQHRDGYPCTIRFENEEHNCHDRESLERILKLMLSDSSVGRQLKRLLGA